MPAPPAYQRIADDLRTQIRTGRLKAGDRLPTQPEMADRYHCSVQPVRAALLRLELEGLIESRQGVGSFVR